MKASIRISVDDLIRSLQGLLHGVAEDVESGYRRISRTREGEGPEGAEGRGDDKRGT